MYMDSDEERELMKDYTFEKLRVIWNSKREKEFNFDEWCKEIDAHPMFMQYFPAEDKVNELVEALQAMKYDTDGSLEEQALAYKGDGNHAFEKFDYPRAIVAYTEGIKIGCSDPKINAELYNNRSAAQFFLSNHRMAFKDCLSARKLDPNHAKVFKRGLDCLINLKCPEEAVKWINEAPDSLTDTLGMYLQWYKNRVMVHMRTREKDKRKQQLLEAKLEKERQQLIEAFKSRNLKFRDCSSIDDITLDWLTLRLPYDHWGGSERVSMTKKGTMKWPVLLLYPEYGTTDFLSELDDSDTLADRVDRILKWVPKWDVNKEYSVENIEMFFENSNKPDTLIKVSVDQPLKEIISHNAYAIVKGVPSFIVLSKVSKFYADYMQKFNVTEF